MEENIQIGLLLLILLLVANIWWRLAKKTSHGGVRRVLLDTSVLIDGRILDLAKTGFLSDELVIPRSVLGELQLLADGNSAEKRTRARFGLDVVTKLQKVDQVTVVILPDERQTPEGVDNRLLELARKQGFALATIDFNLNKVAAVEGVQVLNINELARVVRMQVLPGEQLELKLVQEGQGHDQAIAYLEDGVMVVVSNAKKYIGEVVKVEISRAIQTDAGKMVFADLVQKTKLAAMKAEAKAESAPQSSTTKKQLYRKAKLAQEQRAERTALKQSSQEANHQSSKRRARKNIHRQAKNDQSSSAPKASPKPTSRQRQELYLDRIINDTSSK